jgi:hypothetical protein
MSTVTLQKWQIGNLSLSVIGISRSNSLFGNSLGYREVSR